MDRFIQCKATLYHVPWPGWCSFPLLFPSSFLTDSVLNSSAARTALLAPNFFSASHYFVCSGPTCQKIHNLTFFSAPIKKKDWRRFCVWFCYFRRRFRCRLVPLCRLRIKVIANSQMSNSQRWPPAIALVTAREMARTGDYGVFCFRPRLVIPDGNTKAPPSKVGKNCVEEYNVFGYILYI